MSERNPTDRDRLVEVLAEVHGFKLPLRTFQRMAMEQIFHRELDAILAAGWKPDLASLQMQYDSSQAALSDVLTEHRILVEKIKALADEWEGHGFGTRSGRAYAEELRQAWEESAPT